MTTMTLTPTTPSAPATEHEPDQSWTTWQDYHVRAAFARHVSDYQAQAEREQRSITPTQWEKWRVSAQRQDEEYQKEQREAEAEARRQAEHEAYVERMRVAIELPRVDEDPKVQALAEKLNATRQQAQRALDDAATQLEKARAEADALDAEAVRVEVAAAVGDATEAAAKKAADAAADAWKAVDAAEAEHRTAERANNRAERLADHLEGELEGARSAVQAKRQAAGEAVLEEAVSALREALAVAAEANEHVYKTARELQQRGVTVSQPPHYEGLLRMDVSRVPTTYSRWLERFG